MNQNVYLVEMSFAPFANLPDPAELITFMERMALPTFAALEELERSGRILAGGTTLAAVGLSFIIRANSPQQLEETVSGLPLWPRAQTRVLPLGSFAWRAAAARERLAQLKARVELGGASRPDMISPVQTVGA